MEEKHEKEKEKKKKKKKKHEKERMHQSYSDYKKRHKSHEGHESHKDHRDHGDHKKHDEHDKYNNYHEESRHHHEESRHNHEESRHHHEEPRHHHQDEKKSHYYHSEIKSESKHHDSKEEHKKNSPTKSVHNKKEKEITEKVKSTYNHEHKEVTHKESVKNHIHENENHSFKDIKDYRNVSSYDPLYIKKQDHKFHAPEPTYTSGYANYTRNPVNYSSYNLQTSVVNQPVTQGYTLVPTNIITVPQPGVYYAQSPYQNKVERLGTVSQMYGNGFNRGGMVEGGYYNSDLVPNYLYSGFSSPRYEERYNHLRPYVYNRGVKDLYI